MDKLNQILELDPQEKPTLIVKRDYYKTDFIQRALREAINTLALDPDNKPAKLTLLICETIFIPI